MADYTYALVSRAELNLAVQEPTDNADTQARKEAIVQRVTDQIESYAGRHFVTRGAFTEYHSPRRYDQTIRLSQYPLITLTSVHEDPDWESKVAADWYPATALLVANEDYFSISSAAEPAIQVRLRRIATDWAVGSRVIKVVYSAGYANTAAVPSAVKDVCLDWCKAIWWDESRGKSGASSVSDATGTIARFPPTVMSAAREAALANFIRRDCAPTWERAA